MKFRDAAHFIGWRKKEYQRIPEAVIADLARFCRADESCFHADPRIHAVLEGRREVFLRIAKMRRMTVEELVKEFGGQTWQKNEDE